ncbi:endogenous retrovirus group K3 member 1 [Lemur catta]|uniref:endogenous retrovirus group K3 member 1 n=1 Tax=Lemur catta TaxID=9447 RepID=UPI001E266C51|nr:endogenous retrovirus group K3 member 1 [Lemur catta]
MFVFKLLQVLSGSPPDEFACTMSWKDQPNNLIPQMERLSLQLPLSSGTPPPQTRNTMMAPGITWGQLKQLETQASAMMTQLGAPPTPGNTFLAYLAIVAQNSSQDGGSAN